MKIVDFENLIKAMPVEYQSFDIKYQTWKNAGQKQTINKVLFSKELAEYVFDLVYLIG